MNRIILAGVFLAATMGLKAQNPSFPDGASKGGFESCWEFVSNTALGKEDYWDFKQIYFLSTLNLLHKLEGDMGDAPLTAYRLDKGDIYDGKYSLELVSKPMTLGSETIFLPGVAATMTISISGMSCTLGKPFTAKPTALEGWYKCTPVNGDSAAIEIQLQKNGVTLGVGRKVTTDKITDWTKFSVPVNYTLPDETPDTIIVIFSASGNYDFTDINTLLKCQGQPGSTLYLDNVEYSYETGVKEFFDPAVKLNVYPNPAADKVHLQMEKETAATVIIYDYLIRKVGEFSINGTQLDIDIRHYEAGSYLINVVENNRVITTGRFLKE